MFKDNARQNRQALNSNEQFVPPELDYDTSVASDAKHVKSSLAFDPLRSDGASRIKGIPIADIRSLSIWLINNDLRIKYETKVTTFAET